MSIDIDYENNNIGYDELYPIENGGGIKCKNYEICDEIISKDWSKTTKTNKKSI